MSKTKNKNKLKWKEHREEIGRSYYDSPYWEAKYKGLVFRIEEHWQNEFEIKYYFASCFLAGKEIGVDVYEEGICEYITDESPYESWQIVPLKLAKQRCEDFLDAFTVKEIKSMSIEYKDDNSWWLPIGSNIGRLNDFYDETYMMVDGDAYIEHMKAEAHEAHERYVKTIHRLISLERSNEKVKYG